MLQVPAWKESHTNEAGESEVYKENEAKLDG